jgi:transcriptional regulator with XRE-family HTH domain
MEMGLTMQMIGQKLKAVRLNKDLTLRELGAMAKVSASYLSEIENGKVNPSVTSLYQIADALKLPASYFLDNGTSFEESSLEAKLMPGEVEAKADLVGNGSKSLITNFYGGLSGEAEKKWNPEPNYETFMAPTTPERDSISVRKSPLVHPHERATIELTGGITWQRLTPTTENHMEYIYAIYDIGASTGETMMRHVGRESGLVLQGELLVHLGFESYQLQVGDSITFNSMTPHRLSNPSQVPTHIVWVVFNH